MSFLKIGLAAVGAAAVGYIGYKVYDRARTIPMTPELEAEIAADEAYDAEHGDVAASAARMQTLHDSYRRTFIDGKPETNSSRTEA